MDYIIRRCLLLAPAFGLILLGIALLQPKLKPPAISLANGIYRNACCQPLVLMNGRISSADKSTRYVIETGNRGFHLDVPAGIQVQNGAVKFDGSLVYVPFDKNSVLDQAKAPPKVLHLYSWTDDRSYLFLKDGVAETAEAAVSE